ncbi:MAG: hypothetical protein Ta2G_10070 [Termitinemataceae bacterium]|nr:MAG: hypothetical protein Ta2G_10070 [Termitinemataceae bacterium]
MALIQSMALANATQVILKLSTGRSAPHLKNQDHHTRIDTDKDFSDEFDWFKLDVMDGWPSGHTLSAFATAATLAEIYNDKIWVKIAAYSYAFIMGAGVSLSVHWLSDVLAGALMGYAIGSTVGRSFSKLLKPQANEKTLSVSMTAQPLGVHIQF